MDGMKKEDVLGFLGLSASSVFGKILAVMESREILHLNSAKKKDGAEQTTDFEKACLEVHFASVEEAMKNITSTSIFEDLNPEKAESMMKILGPLKDASDLALQYFSDSIKTRLPQLGKNFGYNEAYEVFEQCNCAICRMSRGELPPLELSALGGMGLGLGSLDEMFEQMAGGE